MNYPSQRHSESQEDYLEAILRISNQKGYCRSVDISKALSVAKPSVSVAITKLREMELVEMDEDKMIHLTEEGLRRARQVYAKHRFFKSWLISIGVDEETAEQEACAIEHDVSDDTFRKMERFYQNCGDGDEAARGTP